MLSDVKLAGVMACCALALFTQEVQAADEEPRVQPEETRTSHADLPRKFASLGTVQPLYALEETLAGLEHWATSRQAKEASAARFEKLLREAVTTANGGAEPSLAQPWQETAAGREFEALNVAWDAHDPKHDDKAEARRLELMKIQAGHDRAAPWLEGKDLWRGTPEERAEDHAGRALYKAHQTLLKAAQEGKSGRDRVRDALTVITSALPYLEQSGPIHAAAYDDAHASWEKMPEASELTKLSLLRARGSSMSRADNLRHAKLIAQNQAHEKLGEHWSGVATAVYASRIWGGKRAEDIVKALPSRASARTLVRPFMKRAAPQRAGAGR